jgi:hypothetical protein
MTVATSSPAASGITHGRIEEACYQFNNTSAEAK